MALDPLRFAIEIADEASQKIEAIKKELNKLEPKIKVTFDESSINVAQLRTALENAIKSLGEIKVSGAGINISGDALGGAAEKITEAKEAIKGGRFGELAKRISEATTELERLTKAFETFQLTIGKDKGLKDFMTGLGEVISNVKTQLGALDKVSNSETSLTKTAEKVETNRRKFNELIESAGKLRTELVNVDSAALNLNMDNPSMRNSIKVINDFIAKLRELRENGGVDFTNNHAVNELIAQFTRLKSALTDVSSEQQRLNKSVSAEGARDDAAAAKEARQNYEAWVESIRRATVEHTKLAITIAQLEDKERKASATGVDTKDLKDQIAGLKQYKDTLKEIADGQKQHGLAKDFIRRADVESAILLAKREGEVVMQNARAREQSDKQMLRDIKQADENQQRFNKVLAEAVAMQERLANAGNKGTHLALDTAKVDEASVKVQQYIDKLLVLDQTQFGSAAKAEWKTIEAGLKAAAVAQEKLNKATEQQQEKDRNRAIKQQAKDAADAAKETEKWANSQNQASIEANKLVQKMRELKAAKMTGKEMGVDTTELERNMAVMQRYLNRLFAIMNGVQKFGHTGDFLGEAPFKNAAFNADKAATNINRLAGDAQKAASATSQLTAEEQRLAQALNQTTEHARGQSQVLSDLKSMAMQYLGVWGGQQFLRNIIEIGGQLEMQRLSIGAILQNQGQANELFEKIKGLAVQSPFGVVELDQMTKQLTAYGFKYNELFDMTKRLADISAATGTGVDRLALALGHVRSEAALSGYTLRQFSMANVPLLQKLSEKLGKTTQEIRKMVRAKEVSYEDVIGVLQDITNEGGMFYNMQEVISQSVKAKFKNVKDAMDIMYGEMAEGYIGDSLKGVADALMEVTRNWKDAATVLGTGAALWAAQRVAVMAYTAAIGKNTAATFSSIAANTEKQGAMLRLANQYRVLTTAERDLMNASKANSAMIRLRTMLGMNYTKAQGTYITAQRTIITNTLTQSLSEGKLTVAELAHMVAVRKLTHEEARLIITNSTLNASLKEQALSIIGSVTQLGRLEIAFMRLGAVMRSIGSMALSFLPMAAITALIELWQHNKREMESAEEMANNVYEAAKNATEATQRMMKETSIQKIDVNGSLAADNLQMPEFDKDTAESVMEQWTQYIREYAGTPNKLINEALASQADGVSSLADQYNKLGDAVKVVIEAQQKLGDFSDVFAAAQKGTDAGWFDDDVANDVKQYISTRKSLRQEIGKYYQENMKNVDRGIKKAREQDEAFRKNTEGMRNEAEMLIYLTENWGYYQDAIRAFGSETGESTDWIKRLGNNLRSQKSEMDVELRRYYAGLQQGLLASGENLDALSPSSQQMLIKGFKMFLDSLGNMSEQEYKERLDNFKKYFKITLDDAEENAQKTLTDWQRRAQDVFTVNSTIKVKSKTITDKDEFAQAVQKDLKEKQEYVDRNTKPIKQLFRIQPNIKFDTEYLGKYIKAISDQIFKLTESGQKEAAGILMSQLNDELIPYYNALRSLEEDEKWLKKEGYPKSDKESKSKNKSKSGSKKAYKDEVAAEWRERIKLLKDANSLYKEWNKRSGEDAALSRVRQQYGDIFEKWRTDKNLPWKDFKAEDIIEYRSYIQKIVDKAQKRYDSQRNDKAKNYGKEAEAVLREGKKLLDDIDKYDFDEKAKDFTAAATKTIDQLTKRWEIFKSAVDTTGDALLAAQLAGFGDTEQGARTVADAMRNELVQRLSEFGNAAFVAKIPLDVDLNEEEVRDKFLDAIPSADAIAVEKYKESISALIKLYQEWQKLQQKANTDDINTYTKIIGLANSYDAQVKKINKDLQEQLASISANPLLSETQKSKGSRMAQASADWKKMKLSADYANLHNRAVAMSAEEYERAEIAIRNMIERLRTLGLLSPEEDISETNALNKAAKERRQDTNGALGHFITGGQQGLRDYYQRLADAALENRSRYTAGSAEWKKADAEYKKNKEKADAIDDEIAGIQATQAALENLQKAAAVLSDFFTAIAGESGDGAALGSISGGAMSGASALSGFGPWGMAAGAILGGATAMIQEGDKAAERAIQDLRGDVRAIETNTEELLKLRERTLGYDSGKYLADLYKNQAALVSDYFANPFDSKEAEKSFHASWGASIMRDWYKELYGGASSGYEAQYNNLIEQRKNYLAILDEQNEKKHKSDEEIAETKSKIAELDDQIMHFSQDLAKELWGIDIKGWADQLSDALASAFENGENMAKAYRDTVTSILQQMMQKMMQMQILEPMFANLQKDLFGENGKGGVFDPNNPKGSMSKVTKIIGDYFGKGGEGEKAITASMEFMTAFQRGMQNAGLTVLNEASNTLSSGIQGTSEETSDLLAGYVNALRQDVSVNRILLTQYVTQLWPQYIEAYTAQVTSVSNIDNNVRVIMEMMQLGNGAMYEQIAAMRTRIDNIVMGIDRVSVR